MIDKLFEKHLTATVLVLVTLFGAGLVFLQADLSLPKSDAAYQKPVIKFFGHDYYSARNSCGSTVNFSWNVVKFSNADPNFRCVRSSNPSNSQWNFTYNYASVNKDSKLITNFTNTTTFTLTCTNQVGGAFSAKSITLPFTACGGGGGGGGDDDPPAF